MAATTTTPLIPFDTAPAAPTSNDIADDHSLLKIDQELDLLMEQIEDEIEESGEASKEAMDRLTGSPHPWVAATVGIREGDSSATNASFKCASSYDCA